VETSSLALTDCSAMGSGNMSSSVSRPGREADQSSKSRPEVKIRLAIPPLLHTLCGLVLN
jgi:hypothetical protein